MKMKLQDNLYTILSQQETEGLATFQLSIHPEWPIYKAHFPGHPITPGVCIVQMVQELLQHALNRDVTLRKAKNVKYLAIISPEEVSELTVSFTKRCPMARSKFRHKSLTAKQSSPKCLLPSRNSQNSHSSHSTHQIKKAPCSSFCKGLSQSNQFAIAYWAAIMVRIYVTSAMSTVPSPFASALGYSAASPLLAIIVKT